MMCTAACVFGLILGELQEIYAASNSKTREMEVAQISSDRWGDGGRGDIAQRFTTRRFTRTTGYRSYGTVLSWLS
jgi:hypothetical protein